VLIIFAITGAFGGILAALQFSDIRRLLDKDHFSVYGDRVYNILLAFAISALCGIGGATAGLFICLLDGRSFKDTSSDGAHYKIKLNDYDRLFFICVGISSGFAGLRFLKTVSDHMEKRFTDVNKKSTKAVRVANQALQEIKHDQLMNAIIQGRLAQQMFLDFRAVKSRLSETDRKSQEEALRKSVEATVDSLKKVLIAFPENRRASMIASWLLVFAQEKIQDGINLLQNTLTHLEKRGDPAPTDIADVNYNLACYCNLLRRKETEPQRRREMLNTIQNHLTVSFALRPGNAAEALADSDLIDVLNEPPLKELLAQHALAPSGGAVKNYPDEGQSAQISPDVQVTQPPASDADAPSGKNLPPAKEND